MRKCPFILLSLILSILLVAGTIRANAQTKGLLWQITGKNIKQPTYLYGTVHLFDTSMYKLPQPVLTKLAGVKQVYFELDFSKLNPMELMQYAMVTDSAQYLDKLLDAEALTKLNEIAKTVPMMQMLGPALYKFKPIFLTTFLLNNGKVVTVDMEMFNKAKQLSIPVGSLETVAEQMQAINAVSIEKQAKMMQDFIKIYPGADVMVKKLTGIYVKQDIDHMLTEMNDNAPIDADFNEALLDKRNVIMADRIAPLLGKQATMIAVGAGHLGGTTGLIALLKKKGYTLKNIPFTFAKAH